MYQVLDKYGRAGNNNRIVSLLLEETDALEKDD